MIYIMFYITFSVTQNFMFYFLFQLVDIDIGRKKKDSRVAWDQGIYVRIAEWGDQGIYVWIGGWVGVRECRMTKLMKCLTPSKALFALLYKI